MKTEPNQSNSTHQNSPKRVDISSVRQLWCAKNNRENWSSKYWIIWNELHKVKGKRCSQTDCRSSQGYDRKSVEWKASMPEMVLVTQSHFCNVFSTQPGIFDITEWFDVFVRVLCSFAIDAINSKKKVCKSMWWRSILLKSQWSHLYALISKTWAHLTHVIFNCVFKPCQTRLEFSQWMFPQWLSSDLFHSEIKSVVE